MLSWDSEGQRTQFCWCWVCIYGSVGLRHLSCPLPLKTSSPCSGALDFRRFSSANCSGATHSYPLILCHPLTLNHCFSASCSQGQPGLKMKWYSHLSRVIPHFPSPFPLRVLGVCRISEIIEPERSWPLPGFITFSRTQLRALESRCHEVCRSHSCIF